MNHIGIITSGGDAPGTNAALRAAARILLNADARVTGIRHSWQGVLDGDVVSIDRDFIHGIIEEGGTVLKSSRTTLLTQKGDAKKIIAALRGQGMDGLIVIGGEGSHKGALALTDAGFPVVGIPKTIDNDLGGTDFTIGFQTAVQTATAAIDNVRTHTESHDQVMVAEVMGRHAGWIAVYAGIASGADLILIPERPWNVDEIREHLDQRHRVQKRAFSLIIVAEGAIASQTSGKAVKDKRTDHLGRAYLGGVGEMLARELARHTGYECRSTNLGYILRGGSPTAQDRILATRLGARAAELLLEGQSGVTVGIRGIDICTTHLGDAVAQLKLVPDELYGLAQKFF